MNWKKDNEEFQRKSDEYDKVKIQCKCGHKTVIPMWVDKQICGWCGKFVFRDKKKEFEYRMKEQLKRVEL